MMKPEMRWCVYVLKDPQTLEVRYVGWTNKKPERRLQGHISDAKRKSTSHVRRWLLSVVNKGLMPIVEVVESGIGDGYDNCERKWIKLYRDSGASLTNITDGGAGCPGRVRSAAERKITSDNRKAYWAKIPQEQRAYIARKSWNKRTPEERSETAKNRQAALGSERRSEIARKREAAITPEQRRQSAIKSRNSLSPEQRSEIARKRESGMTPEARSERSKRAAAGRTAEERSVSAKKQWLRLTAEQRSEILKRNWSKMKPGLRSAISKRTQAGISPERRSEIGRIGYLAMRAKVAS